MFERLDVVLVGAVGDGGFRRVRAGAAELFRGDDLIGDRLHDVRAGHEHVGTVAHHEDKVGHRRRIDGAAGAGAHDHRDLRNDARNLGIAAEDLGIRPASEATPSWMRAPPESLRPITGAPLRAAMSMILQIFWACVSESEPPRTVKSWLKT
jgi:hypothetical protein